MIKQIKNFLKKITVLNIIYQYLNNVRNGYRVYAKFPKKYGENYKIIFSPYEGCGDAYLLGKLFDEYLKKDKIENYVVLTPSELGYKILSLFKISPLECISIEERNKIIKFGTFLGFSRVNIGIPHFNSYSHTEIMNNVEGIHSLDFFSMFSFVRLNSKDPVLRAIIFEIKNPWNQLMIEKGIGEGKTVLLFPRANSIPSPSDCFWYKLSEFLKGKGYIVCTNIKANEKPIKGTIPIYIPIEQIDATLSFAGYFIGSRSGICDIISNTECKKIVIYPKNYRWGASFVDEYFSLQNMGLCHDAIEISYKREQEDTLFDEIIYNF
ncbi:MAG: hypothetical protein HFE97_12345 [Oscillospiraceae bacterium]|nr:hypothetical protein [Oscillospiraceae bacterium]